MKTRITKIIACLLCALMLILCGCGSSARVAVSFGSTEFTENMYSYWMSVYKAAFLYQLTGSTTDNIAYWTTELGNGVTYGDYFGAMATAQIMTNAVLHELFTTYNLELTAAEQNAIDAQIDSLVTQVGSVTALNSVLSAYGVNKDILKEIKTIEYKVSKLQDYLYGTNGIDAATDEELDEYYKSNYYRAKYIFISTQVDYERDENGAVIVDEETGYYTTRELTDTEIEEKKALAKDLEARVAAGEDFDKLVLEHSMELGMQEFPDGYYFTTASTYVYADVMSSVQEMAIDEIKTVESDYGTFIIKRYELQDKKYEDDDYLAMFTDFVSNVNMVKMQTMAASYSDSVVVNDAVIADYPFATATPDFYY